MNPSYPDDPVESAEAPHPTPDRAPDPAPDPAVVARLLALDHAAALTTVARQRLWLLDALARGEDILDLASELKVTPRAIRHLLGPVGR